MENKNGNVQDWDTYLPGSFLKATDVEGVQDLFEITKVGEVIDDRDNQKVVRLRLKKGDRDFLFDLNKTNASFLRNSGIKHPQELQGKKIQFNKVMVVNPQTKREVEGLRIFKVF